MTADRRDKPPAPRWLGNLLEPLYRRAIADRNRRFEAGEGVEVLPLPVISVGNLSVGGTGKTPMVMRIVEMAQSSGRRPCVAMRGYKRGAAQHSDEQAEYLERFPGIPIVAQPERAQGIRTLLAADPNACDCIILDDGFQHRRIARDLDIVLIDATRDVFSDRCLPAGWLREPVESLDRADVVVITHAEAVAPDSLDRLSARVREFAPRATLCIARHEWECLRIGDERRSPQWLAGKSVAVACGIGHPSAFIASIQRAGADIRVRVVRADHHAWTAKDLAELNQSRVDAILTTAKDWSKLRHLLAGWQGPPFARPELRMDLFSGESELIRRLHHALTTSRTEAPPATVSA